MLRKVVTKMIPWSNFLLKVTPVTPVAMNNLGCGGLDDHTRWGSQIMERHRSWNITENHSIGSNQEAG